MYESGFLGNTLNLKQVKGFFGITYYSVYFKYFLKRIIQQIAKKQEGKQARRPVNDEQCIVFLSSSFLCFIVKKRMNFLFGSIKKVIGRYVS